MYEAPREGDLQARIATMERELAELRKRQAAVQNTGPGIAFAGDDNLVISGTVRGHVIRVYHAAPGKPRLTDDEVAHILGEYLAWVRRAHDQARLFGGGSSALMTKPQSVRRLTEIFVPLTLRRFIPPRRQEQEKALRGKAGLDYLLALRELDLAPDRRGDVLPLANLLTVSRRIAIVGGAGSGKSTILAHLAATLARAAGSAEPCPYRLPEPQAPIPLVAPLRYYRTYQDECCNSPGKMLDDPRAGTLAGFIPWYLRHRNPVLETSQDFFDRLLLGGGCLLMIDGLDEVTSREQRGQVRAAIDDLAASIYPGNRIIVTARTAGYREEAVFGDDFIRLDVEDLTPEQIAQLVENWCSRLYPQNVTGSRDALLDAIGYINELRQERDLPPLINTPLMTTMVVGVQWEDTELPRERARLYEASVRTILQAQYVPEDPGAEGAKRTLVNWGGPWEAQRNWLSELALAMHSGGSSAAAIREERVREILRPILPADSLDAFVHAVRYRGGLFEERGEFFQFIHLTFQEFLAARVLAKRRDAAYPLLLPHLTESWWRELLLLTYGYLLMDHEPAAADYLHWLSTLKGRDAVRLAAAELAGAAVLEIEQPDPAVRRRQADRLVALLADMQLSVPGPLRAAAGQTLGRLGDPRPGVGLRPDGPSTGSGQAVPDIAWCDVKAGPFIMGNTQQTDDMAYVDEAPQHTEQIRDPYRISKYPITNAQFDAFVRDGGYTAKWRSCWTQAGWQWKGSQIEPDKYGGVYDLPNHPAVMVTWYEAVAFCNWLGQKLGMDVSLPTEAQWERAARGGMPQVTGTSEVPVTSRRYPWGEQITPDHANYDETGVGTTTEAGIFPKGANPETGVLDMSGNVWEWCRTKWRESYRGKPDDGLDGNATRILRGGAFYEEARRVRCAARDGVNPNNRNGDIGFRVVASPIIRDSGR